MNEALKKNLLFQTPWKALLQLVSFKTHFCHTRNFNTLDLTIFFYKGMPGIFFNFPKVLK